MEMEQWRKEIRERKAMDKYKKRKEFALALAIQFGTMLLLCGICMACMR